jgi:hypothetical protein
LRDCYRTVRETGRSVYMVHRPLYDGALGCGVAAIIRGLFGVHPGSLGLAHSGYLRARIRGSFRALLRGRRENVSRHTGEPGFYSPMNEISFFAASRGLSGADRSAVGAHSETVPRAVSPLPRRPFFAPFLYRPDQRHVIHSPLQWSAPRSGNLWR